MTKNSRKIGWWLLGGVGLALALGFVLNHSGSSLPLPAVVRYANLPENFNQALQDARTRVAATGGDATSLRKLAHLYQANRLHPEARVCYRLLATNQAGLNAHDHYYLADIALNEGDLDGAQKEIRITLAAEPGYLPATWLWRKRFSNPDALKKRPRNTRRFWPLKRTIRRHRWVWPG